MLGLYPLNTQESSVGLGKSTTISHFNKINRFHVDAGLFDTGELKQAIFLSHRRKPEVNISDTRTVVFPRFSKPILSTSEKMCNNINVDTCRKTA